MPTKRQRRTRRRIEGVTDAELQWLRGEPETPENCWVYLDLNCACSDADKAHREWLLSEFADLIPPRRRKEIEGPSVAERLAELRQELAAKQAESPNVKWPSLEALIRNLEQQMEHSNDE